MTKKPILALILFAIIKITFAGSQEEYSTSINTADETLASSSLKYFTDLFLNTFDSLTNNEDSWGVQNREGH
ncbi:hypothetical protein AS144_07160 [Francisella endosymbiont of Amblyomma maculatum]|nr:hypothetical protein AS144_07160 [Francisella endosymbiont of Amblyomma maculatum]